MGERERLRRERLAAGEIYGTIVCLTVLVLLEEDRTPPAEAIGILSGTAFIFWLAHVYAHLVPGIAADGHLGASRLVATARDQVGILRAVIIPAVPLALAVVGLLEDRTAARLALVAGLAALAGFAVREARLAGLEWLRSIVVAVMLLIAGVGLLWLEVSLH